MLNKSRWNKVNEFKAKQKILFLNGLTPQQSLKIYSHLYELAYSIGAKRYCAEVNSEKIKRLARTHSLLRKAGL